MLYVTQDQKLLIFLNQQTHNELKIVENYVSMNEHSLRTEKRVLGPNYVLTLN